MQGAEFVKTIREIAEEIGVTRQAVYSKIKEPNLANALEPLVSRGDNVLTVSLDGEKLIKQAFGVGGAVKELSSVDSSLTALLYSVVEILHEQIHIKDRQIAEQNATIKALIKSANHKPPKRTYQRKKLKVPKGKSAPIHRLMGSARKSTQG